MSDLVTSLKALGAKMTGEDIVGKDLVQVVDNITENYEGGGGGAGGTVIIKLTGNPQMSPTGLSIDKTFSEILELVNAGNLDIVIESNEFAHNPYYRLSGYYGALPDSCTSFEFVHTYTSSPSAYISQLTIDSNNNITYYQKVVS